MRFLSLFAGVGGFDLGLERAGHECVGQVEIDPFCQRVLAARWPGVERWGDVRGVVDPSRCPTGRSSEDALSRCRRSRSSTERGIGDSERDQLHGECWRAAVSRVDLLTGGFPCQDLSVAGKRAGLSGERSGLFYEIVRIATALKPTWGLFENVPGLLSSHGGCDMALVLEGLRECWPVVGYRVLDSRYFGVAQRRRRVFFVCGPDEARVASVLFEPEGGGVDLATRGEAGARVAAGLTAGAHGTGVRHMGGGGADDNEAQAGHLIPDVAWALQERDAKAPPLKQGSGVDIPWAPAVAFDTTQITSNKNYSNPKPGDPCHPLAADAHAPAIASPMAVRRLTPTECERLQSFPDGWTCLDVPLEAWARDPESAAERCTCPDSPRYRAMGNAVTVNVITWIGHRLMAALIP